jgi:Na+/H+ antiporter NhaD/arsenite permease-like protein
MDKEKGNREKDISTLRMMVEYFHLSHISEVTLIKNELNLLYQGVYKEDFITDKKIFWDHNMDCLPFFMGLFVNMVRIGRV